MDTKTIQDNEVVAIPCAFINSNGPPTDIGPWLAFKVTKKEKKLCLSGTRLYTYRHPEAPEVAILTVLQEDFICEHKESDPEYSVLYSLMQAENATKFLLKIKDGERKEW